MINGVNWVRFFDKFDRMFSKTSCILVQAYIVRTRKLKRSYLRLNIQGDPLQNICLISPTFIVQPVSLKIMLKPNI